MLEWITPRKSQYPRKYFPRTACGSRPTVGVVELGGDHGGLLSSSCFLQDVRAGYSSLRRMKVRLRVGSLVDRLELRGMLAGKSASFRASVLELQLMSRCDCLVRIIAI